MIRAPYDALLPGWFDGTKTGRFLEEDLPARIEDLVTGAFLAHHAAGIEEPSWFYEGLVAADTSDYVPRAPLRLHYGRTDTTVIPEESSAAFRRMRERGGNVQLVDVGPYDHDQVVVPSLPLIRRWFDELARGEP